MSSRSATGTAHAEAASTRTAPRLGARIAIALMCAASAWLVSTLKLEQAGPGYFAGDFTTLWRGARALLDGSSPYVVIDPLPLRSHESGYLYPLPAAALLVPLATLGMRTALPIFAAASVGTFAFALTRDGLWRLPLLLSLPVYWAVASGQWAPLLVSAALLAPLALVASVKPTLGLAVFAFRPTRRFAAIASVPVVLTLLAWPWWPAQWLAEVGDRAAAYYHVPITMPGGILLALAALRWRRPEARVLLVMACVPQTMLYYDQLPLALAARSYRDALAFALVSWAAPFVAIWIHGPDPAPIGVLLSRTAPIVLAIYYAPVLLVVLARRNEGDLPAALERVTARLPAWLRGSSTADRQHA